MPRSDSWQPGRVAWWRQASSLRSSCWRQGEDVIFAGSVSDDAAKEIYPDGWDAPRPYIRIVPQPR
jgi:hypothetical protein